MKNINILIFVDRKVGEVILGNPQSNKCIEKQTLFFCSSVPKNDVKSMLKGDPQKGKNKSKAIPKARRDNVLSILVWF